MPNHGHFRTFHRATGEQQGLQSAWNLFCGRHTQHTPADKDHRFNHTNLQTHIDSRINKKSPPVSFGPSHRLFGSNSNLPISIQSQSPVPAPSPHRPSPSQSPTFVLVSVPSPVLQSQVPVAVLVVVPVPVSNRNLSFTATSQLPLRATHVQAFGCACQAVTK